MEIKNIDKNKGEVHFDDNTFIDVKAFKEQFYKFLHKRVAGETLIPNDMERFMSRTSAKNLKMLMKGKKAEGYMEGSMDKMLSKRQTVALMTIVTIIMVAVIALVVLKNQGIL